MGNLQLETLFSDEKLLFQRDHRHLEQLLLLLRLEGNCSLLSISSILKALEYHPNSVGYLSQFFQSAAQVLPSTLLMPSKSFVFYLRDEIFALHTPSLVTIDARSTGTHVRRDTVISQWFQDSQAAAASDGHAVHF